jgi:hypothetical protein
MQGFAGQEGLPGEKGMKGERFDKSKLITLKFRDYL